MSGFPRVQRVRPIHVPAELCLLCSSSLPPRSTSTSARASSSSSSSSVQTSCCRRTICASCVARSPRTARWDPCLACEGGWRATRTDGNADGNVAERESDFVLGDAEEDEDDEHPKAEQTTPQDDGSATQTTGDVVAPDSAEAPEPASSALVRHIVTKSDTLIGIALKYGLDPHALCALNSLPQSTIHTTPHLLHTRVYLLLLPSPPPPLPASVQNHLRHERAIACFARVTKEDDAVVRAYVGLAESGDLSLPADAAEYEGDKEKMSTTKPSPVDDSTEARAVGRYFADAEWERANPPGVRPMGFPVASGSGWKSASGSTNAPRSSPSSWWSGWGSSTKKEAAPAAGKEAAGVKVG